MLAAWKLCLAALVGLAAASEQTYRAVAVPSFAFASLQDEAPELLQKLQNIGIITVSDIPGYYQAREQYLLAATKCINDQATQNARGVQTKTLNDGTRRLTISTKAQVGNPSVAQPRVDCPEYTTKLREFSALVDEVSVQFAKALDSTNAGASATTSSSLEDIVTRGAHLDHFHAYSSPLTSTQSASEGQISLSLHTDSGLAIAMTVPEHFHVVDGEPQPVANDEIVSGPSASGGLVIELPDTHELVQPILNKDELVIMIGEGLSAWTETVHKINPVLHGMQMPSFSADMGKTTRAWFGKMLLLPRGDKMKNTGIDFDAYTNMTTEYVVNGATDTIFSSVACPPTKRLLASDKGCTIVVAEPKLGSDATMEDCMGYCNSDHQQVFCRHKCDVTGKVANGGLDCWMLCVPKSNCPPGKSPACDPNGEQALVCN